MYISIWIQDRNTNNQLYTYTCICIFVCQKNGSIFIASIRQPLITIIKLNTSIQAMVC
jgi:hypothetical protein